MTDRATGGPHLVTLPEAADLLSLPPEAVLALVTAGYLATTNEGPDGLEFPLVDLKAYLARNADNGSGNLFLTEPSSVDPQALIDALDGKSDDMARRAFEIFSTVFPEAHGWPLADQAKFMDQAKSRFEAILAVTSQGAEVDEALVRDLQEVGAAAAWADSPLPHLLVILRISRDLVVQTAVELAEDRGRHWSMALSLVLTRVLPAMDRLTDALAAGYWAAVVRREEEQRERHQAIVEQSSDGVYEADLDGRVLYANTSLAVILGHDLEELHGALLADVLRPVDADESADSLLVDPPEGARQLDMTVVRTDGVRRALDIRVHARRRDGMVLGFQGVVRDVTALRDLEADKNEFMALVTKDLRQPLTTILGLGATLESHSDEVSQEQIAKVGSSIRRQAERIARLADDLYDVSRLEAQSLLLSPRPVPLRQTVLTALQSLQGEAEVDVAIDDTLLVLADPRRLEQVFANLVENAVIHGLPPIRVEARPTSNGVEVSVVDRGPGIPESLVPTLFSSLRTLTRRDRDRSRGTGLGLALVRGLVEAMGGRVWYERAETSGSRFRVVLLSPAVGEHSAGPAVY
ncbi:MAG TPA: ATP-binding protein [Acidimicrobiales bacterium]|nr:ATP-binding protein [Acidimicrobiales bacterium]